MIADFARRKAEKVGILGVTPFYSNATETEFLKQTGLPWSLFDQGSKDITEELYSQVGS